MSSTDRPDVFQPFFEASREELNDLWSELGDQIDELDQQQQELSRRRQILEARKTALESIAVVRKLELGDNTSFSRRVPDQTVSAPSIPSEEPVNGSTPTKPREIALALLDEDPTTIWDAEKMHSALSDRGIHTSRENVRVILQRLYRTGGIRRVGHGAYQSARASSDSLLTEGDGT
jgi:DNA repair exonuclease SbcCD ATPase subunit